MNREEGIRMRFNSNQFFILNICSTFLKDGAVRRVHLIGVNPSDKRLQRSNRVTIAS